MYVCGDLVQKTRNERGEGGGGEEVKPVNVRMY